MKYIRTKDGIGVFRNAGDDNDSNYNYVAFNKYARPYNDLDIIKQADTIEELCDEFVAYKKVDDEYTKFTPHILDNYKDLVREKDYILEHYNVYGAIWTGKGLIYVAKMNNNGELDLL